MLHMMHECARRHVYGHVINGCFSGHHTARVYACMYVRACEYVLDLHMITYLPAARCMHSCMYTSSALTAASSFAVLVSDLELSSSALHGRSNQAVVEHTHAYIHTCIRSYVYTFICVLNTTDYPPILLNYQNQENARDACPTTSQGVTNVPVSV
jgi:hypothetical protein